MKVDREHYWLWGLAALGACLRWWYLCDFADLLHFDLAIGADVMEYHHRALELLNGKFFPEQPDIHAPLYSWFLALVYWITGISVPAARIVQTIINYCAWFLGFYLLKRELSSPPVVRLVFFAFGMLTPVLYFHQAELISESLIIPLLMVEIYLLYHFRNRWQLFFAGIAGGLTVLTHGLLLPFAGLVSLPLLFRKKWWNGVYFLTGLIVVIAPFIIAKSHHYGRIMFIQENGAFNLFLGNNRFSDGGCYMRPGLWWRRTHSKAQYEAKKQGISVDQWWLEQVWDFWSKHPKKAFKLTLKKAWMVWSPVEKIAGADPDSLVYRSSVVFALRSMIGVAFVFSAIGVLNVIRRKENRYWIFYILVVSLWLAQVITVTSGRYRLAMLPGVFLLAGIGFTCVNWYRYWLLLPAIWLFFCGTCLGTNRLDETASIIGEAAFVKGKNDLAHTLLSYAERSIKDPARFDNMLGALAERKGDYIQAETRYRRAAKIEPWKWEAWMNLGNLLGMNPARKREAYHCFQQALKFGKSEALVCYNYACFLDRNGQSSENWLRKALNANPRMDSAWNMLGILQMKQGKYHDARHSFTQAAKFNPKEAGYARNLEIAERTLNI